jgi:carboxymethylenebutenolidase
MIMSDRQPMQHESDFDPEVMLVFDQYVHGDIDRRTFPERVGRLAVETVTAAGLLGALPNLAAAAHEMVLQA